MKSVLITGACVNTGVSIVEKFAGEGYRVIFTGRDAERVLKAEKRYRENFPDREIYGYAINSLLDERTVDEDAVDRMFSWLDEMGIFSSLHATQMFLFLQHLDCLFLF